MAQQLDPNDILTAEFHYIAQAAAQNNEDRARVATNYLVTFGSFIAAALSAQSDGLSEAARQTLNLTFGGIFTLLSVYSILTVLQLVRLRQAWIDCVRAMNKIKDTYAANSADFPIKEAFLWNTGGIPRPFKWWSISFVQALQVSLLGGLAAGTAAEFFQPNLALSMTKGVGVFLAQMILYWWRLRK
jgi:hypothetical protein